MRRIGPRFIIPCSVLLAWSLFAATASSGADDDSWVGKTIVLKRDGVKIGHTGADGEQVFVADLSDIAYTVLNEKDGWLHVRQRGSEGWFAKDEAVLLKDATPYFTARILANEGDALAYAHRGRAWA